MYAPLFLLVRNSDGSNQTNKQEAEHQFSDVTAEEGESLLSPESPTKENSSSGDEHIKGVVRSENNSIYAKSGQA